MCWPGGINAREVGEISELDRGPALATLILDSLGPSVELKAKLNRLSSSDKKEFLRYAAAVGDEALVKAYSHLLAIAEPLFQSPNFSLIGGANPLIGLGSGKSVCALEWAILKLNPEMVELFLQRIVDRGYQCLELIPFIRGKLATVKLSTRQSASELWKKLFIVKALKMYCHRWLATN